MVLCGEQAVKITNESTLPKLMELTEKEGERKFLKNSLDKNANELLREHKAYVLSHVKINDHDEQIIENILIDGHCMRTPEKDIKWEYKQKELQAAAQKGVKKSPSTKKK